jgi:hypothetical protein
VLSAFSLVCTRGRKPTGCPHVQIEAVSDMLCAHQTPACAPEKQKRNSPSDTGTPGHVTKGGCWCVKPVTVAPSHPTNASRATEAKMPPTDRKDSRDKSRSHTVGSTNSAASKIRVCSAAGVQG